jgi:hypothetical protein
MKVRWMLVALLTMALLPTIANAYPRSASSAALPYAAALPQDHDWEHHDWEHDERFHGRTPGYRQGFRDGSDDGHRDRDAGRKFHFGPGWKHPDRGYRPEFGDKHDYEHEYRHGYEDGYKDGYH